VRFSHLPDGAPDAIHEPYFSETGYRSFLGLHAAYVPGLTPQTFAEAALKSYIAIALKGRLVPVVPRYRAAC
jgi:hypothetical protein